MKKYNIHEAIEKRKIIPFSAGPKVSRKELKIAKGDLQDAKDVLELGKIKLATVSAYYAIFHASRALLYKKRYREKSHIQLALAIRTFFVDEKLLPEEFYDSFIEAISLREMADYKGKFSEEGAEKNIQPAEKAVKSAEGLLNKIKA